MDTATSPPSTTRDPIGLIAQLSADEIRARLDELDAEQRALRVLLRSVAARERALARRRETTHAG
jgi:hypothetical protein